jgi:hypothetical protein
MFSFHDWNLIFAMLGTFGRLRSRARSSTQSERAAATDADRAAYMAAMSLACKIGAENGFHMQTSAER